MTRVHGASARPWVDVAKAVAAQCIVLHHLAFYGPMVDIAWPLLPTVFEFLARHARMAVHVFLVVAGYLAALHLAVHTALRPQIEPGHAVAARYLRLMLPGAAALLLAIAASWVARQWMSHPSIGDPASGLQLLGHLALMQDIVGLPSLSAGIWYLAIDFQLYVLLLMALWVGRFVSKPWVAPAAVACLTAGSLLVFNRMAWLDPWAIYFMGSYGLGVLAAWWSGAKQRWLWLALAGAVLALALFIDWRARLALAAVTAMALIALEGRFAVARHIQGMTAYLASRSYALFLVHFPVMLVVGAAFQRFGAQTPAVQALGMVCAWLASMVVTEAFHRVVEGPALRAIKQLRLA